MITVSCPASGNNLDFNFAIGYIHGLPLFFRTSFLFVGGVGAVPRDERVRGGGDGELVRNPDL